MTRNSDEAKLPDLADGVSSDSCPEGSLFAGALDGKPVVLVRRDGTVCALSGSCTHLGAPLADGSLIDGELRCPWHHARFSLSTGEATGAPAFEPLHRFAVSESGGRIRIGDRLDPAPALPGVLDAKVVIIGAGAAGHACAELLARRGHGAQVTLVGDEGEAPYDRTFCSKQYLAGEKARGDSALAALGEGASTVVLRTGVKVESIDIAERTVQLQDGETLPFTALVIATGATPVPPDFAGADHQSVYLLRTLGDADVLIKAAKSARTAAIVGASFIGLEVAASLIARKLKVTVVAPEELPLASKMGDEVGHFVQHLHEKNGVRFCLGRNAKSYDGRELTLDDGTRIEADLVIAGIGVEPRVDLAKAAGLQIAGRDDGGGVLVDSRLQASEPNVFAVGDIASYPDARLDKRIRVEHWVQAQRQGQFVARYLLGEATEFIDTPFFWSGHYDQNLRYVGRGSPKRHVLDGDVAANDFAIGYKAESGDTTEALLTCGRDQESLHIEARWDDEASGA